MEPVSILTPGRMTTGGPLFRLPVHLGVAHLRSCHAGEAVVRLGIERSVVNGLRGLDGDHIEHKVALIMGAGGMESGLAFAVGERAVLRRGKARPGARDHCPRHRGARTVQNRDRGGGHSAPLAVAGVHGNAEHRDLRLGRGRNDGLNRGGIFGKSCRKTCEEQTKRSEPGPREMWKGVHKPANIKTIITPNTSKRHLLDNQKACQRVSGSSNRVRGGQRYCWSGKEPMLLRVVAVREETAPAGAPGASARP